MKEILVVGFFGVTALVILAAVAGLVWYFAYAIKARAAASNLAAQLGWKPLAPATGPADTWYGGVAQGRRVAIRLAALRNPTATDGARNGPHLRIVMDIVVREPLGASALRSQRDHSSLHRFEEAFSVRNVGRFGPGARQAMVEFVSKGYPTGMQGVTYRATPGTRNLWIVDRETVPESFLHPAVLADARTIIHHDHPHPKISQEDFGKLLYEMSQIAYAIEQHR